MNRTWTFTDLEFLVQWQELREDFLPRPFMFTTRTRSNDEHMREQRETLARLRSSMDRSFRGVLEEIARPDIQIIVRGLIDPGPDELVQERRLHAARRGEHGYLVKYLPDPDDDRSGRYTITECDPFGLADAVVAELEQAPAGRKSHMQLPTKHTELQDQNESMLWDSFESPDTEAGKQFLKAQLTSIGGIEIIQGTSRFGPRGRVSRYLEWRDVVDDGRYLIVPDNPPVVRGVDAKRMVSLINTEIAVVVQAIRDERVQV